MMSTPHVIRATPHTCLRQVDLRWKEPTLLLLISPDSVEEALDCAKAAQHLDIVDVKKPDEGSLGANYPWVIRDIRTAVPADKPVSATVGDVPYKPGTVAQAALGAAVSGATYIKVGLYGCTTPEQAVEVMRGVVRAVKDYRPDAFVVASGYADAHRIGCVNPLALPEIARLSGSDAAMLDTAVKDGTRLFDHVPPDACAEFVRLAHEADLLAALAGSIKAEDLATLTGIGTDIVGVRGAVCERGTAPPAGSSRSWWQPSGRRWTGMPARTRQPRSPRADHPACRRDNPLASLEAVKCFAVLDPATGEPFDEAPDHDPDTLDAVVDAAHVAWRGWREDPAARTGALLAAADAVEAAGADLAPCSPVSRANPCPSRMRRSPGRQPVFAISPSWTPAHSPSRTGGRYAARSAGGRSVRSPPSSRGTFPSSSPRRSSRPRSPQATRWCSNPRRTPLSPHACWGRSSPPPSPRTY